MVIARFPGIHVLSNKDLALGCCVGEGAFSVKKTQTNSGCLEPWGDSLSCITSPKVGILHPGHARPLLDSWTFCGQNVHPDMSGGVGGSLGRVGLSSSLHTPSRVLHAHLVISPITGSVSHYASTMTCGLLHPFIWSWAPCEQRTTAMNSLLLKRSTASYQGIPCGGEQ